MLELTQSIYPDLTAAKSCLEDLPIAKARNNYSKFVNAKPEPLPTNMSREKHVLYFCLFRLEAKHFKETNAVLLEEVMGTRALSIKSPSTYAALWNHTFSVRCRA